MELYFGSLKEVTALGRRVQVKNTEQEEEEEEKETTTEVSVKRSECVLPLGKAACV